MRFIKKNFLIIFVLLAGAALRLWGINFGLPYVLHQDEPIVVNHALAYGSGDLNPHFFIIPPLCSYLLFACYGAFFVLGKIAGVFHNADGFAFSFFNDPTVFYMIARIFLGSIPGIVSIGLVYAVYKKMFSDNGAWYAAAIAAFSFLPVVNSHYAYVDNMMVLFILATYLSIIKMTEAPNLKNYILAGFFLGLAAAVKYNAAILITVFFVAHMKIVHDRKNNYFWIAIAVICAAFVAANPFSVIDWHSFISTVFGKIRATYMGWAHHITYSAIEGMGSPIVILGFLGFCVILARESLSKKAIFLAFPIIFYVHLAFRSQVFSRYAMPLVPFFAIATAYFIFGYIVPKVQNRLIKGLILLIAVAAVVPTAVKSVKADVLFSSGDTRIVSAEWIEKNLPAKTRIAVDHSSFRPEIYQAKEQLTEKFGMTGIEAGLKDIKDRKLGLMIKAVENKKTYNIYFLTDREVQEVKFLSMAPAIDYNMNALTENGVEYVVMSNIKANSKKDEFLKQLKENADVVAEFDPYYDKTINRPFDRIDNTFMAISSKELFARKMTGPGLVIYKLRRQ